MTARARRLRARLVLALLAVLAPGATAAHAQTPAMPATPTYTERYRPQYHFTPAANWMNDPNGLVFHDGEYHLFYQYNPFGSTWGHMSWGHAVSPDLVHWQHLPVAIPEVDSVMAFSGSAVVDRENTSGFGRDGQPPLVAIYTAHRTDRPSQSQYLAYSTDRGRTWTRHAGNPVLDVGKADFRDPKVFWHEPDRRWIMVVSLSPEYKVQLYASPDLKRWTYLSEFGSAGATGGIWECPDLFPLPVDGDPARTRWVLVVNLNPGAIAGGSGVQYFIGDFDGVRFTPDRDGAARAEKDASGSPDAAGGIRALWADHGQDFYAAVSWSDVPRDDGRRIWIGWMSNWLYANELPTAPWRSAQSLPRTLALRTTPEGVRLVQQPVRELERLRGAPWRLGARTIAAGTTPLGPAGIAGKALEIAAEFEVGGAGGARELGLKVRTGPGEETVIGIDPHGHRLFVDRSRSGDVGFHRDVGLRQSAPLPVENGRVRLRVFVDWSSVEVFAGDGRAVITDRIFPSPASDGVALYAVGGAARLVSLEAWPMASAWTGGRGGDAGGAAPRRGGGAR